jgi:hypothetical protein
MFNQEVKKLQNYNQEVQKFFIDLMVNDDKFNTINDILHWYNLSFMGVTSERLTPGSYNFLNNNFPETMKTLQNGCKPDYMPSWIKINHCEKRKEACNFHDFLYWIAWPRANSDKLFIKRMNQVCKGFGNKIYNYSFYWVVRAFGQTAYSDEEKTLDDFFMLVLD